ncbi:MAG: hypothetical protein HN757_11425, partial [Calditrichaeota bacterium]|nr:hypothetical protein [Calditrichota bacterium]
KLIPPNNVATRSRPRNDSVNFALFDGGRANEENPIDRVDAIKNELELTKEVEVILDFIENSDRGIIKG